jgi:putative nucleotidyltransferase with HDIG domain
MRKWLINISNQHENILKLLIFSASLILILWMLPHQIRYKFDYTLGKPWSYDDLKAPYDFAIEKNKDSIETEKKLRLTYAPYFIKTDSQSVQLINKRVSELDFFNSLDSINNLNKQNNRVKIDLLVASLINKGVINEESLPEYEAGNSLKMISGNGYKDVSLKNFEQLKNVKDFLIKASQEKGISLQETIIDEIANQFQPTIIPDKELNNSYRSEVLQSVSPTAGIVNQGEHIISKGEIVTAQKIQILTSLKNVSENFSEPNKHVFAGQTLLVIICMTMLMLFLRQLRKDIYNDNRKLTLIFLLILFTVFIYTYVLKSGTISLYLVPVCILPIVIRTFFDTRMALFTYVITVLVLGSVAPNSYEFVFAQVVAGMVTIFSVKNMRKRSHAFFAVLMIFVSYLLSYIAIEIVHEGNITSINWQNAGWLLGNVLLVLFAYPLIYFLEKIFNITSDISLVELADSNNTLLRELSIKAPGTFQHSLQVANLAEAAIFKIGGNALLMRVGALYHDIGKMEMPLYFIENQTTQVNPHDELAFEESASIIISHVIKGIEKAKKNNVPDLVIDFIRTHHGTSLVQYFYESFLKNYPDKIVDENMFHYPGPKPYSKETAVLMMADSVEAASRSLQVHDAANISKLVDSIIENQIEQGQFDNCPVTFRDITEIKKIFKKMLGSIYHVRVEYPSH